MFISIGTRLKQIRRQYNLKQSAFTPFGYSQNHISMIEKDKRTLTQKNIKHVYETLEILTEGKINRDCSFEEFKLTEAEQAKRWLSDHCEVEFGLSQYDLYKEIAYTYDFISFQIELDVKLAYYYKEKRELLKSNHYFLGAITGCTQLSKNSSTYYRQVALNHLELGKYHDAISYLTQAIAQATEDDVDLIYSAHYELGRCYFYLDQYDKSLDYINVLLQQDADLKFKALAILLKENVLKKAGYAKEGQDVLIDFIENCFYEPFLSYAYHNLACNYGDNEMYDEALKILIQSLKLRKSDLNKAMTICLIGEMYYRIKDYEQAIFYLSQGIERVLTDANINQKNNAIETLCLCYLKTKQLDTLIQFINRLQQLIIEEQFHKLNLLDIKNKLYKEMIENHFKTATSLDEYKELICHL